ncbi:MAG TPA: poly-gamma-glutamate hydrolase family protein [Acidimicrobiales bacterium]|jgi:phage replication-related protein YjqB (UPF0714/DUF867 family)|nr:poly-gamma-glutamate hydrolase family protein [Acidimicrobiales bacterium]
MDLAELLALPGVEETCVLRSAVGFMALHGGSQDRGTHEIASCAAEKSGASYYAIVQPGNLRVHLTSRHHDPGQSQKMSAFLRHVEVAISVHGFGRDSFSFHVDSGSGPVIEPYGPARRGRQTGPLRGIIVGGLNADLVDAACGILRDRLPGYHAGSERVRLGFHPRNPVNLPAAHGVQIELPPALRGIGDLGEDYVPSRDGIVTDVVAALVALAERATQILGIQSPASPGPARSGST